jgi:carbon-monoxide dehydrogenase medium subunit
MYAFNYQRPKTVRQAAGLLAKAGGDGKLLAGGQTLLPTMKQRLASPAMLIDLNQVDGMSGIELKGRNLHIGAMTKHADVANSHVVKTAIPGLAALAEGIGDPAVRNRGTIGGSIANNDPAADYPAACLGLGATIVTNKRKIPADEFFSGMFETALEDGEIVTKVIFPVPQKAAYEKFPNPASRYAMVGVFVGKKGSDVRVAVTGAGANGVFRLPEFEAALKTRFNAKSLDGLTVPADGLNGDIHASPDYRAHLIGVMAKRAVNKALGK